MYRKTPLLTRKGAQMSIFGKRALMSILWLTILILCNCSKDDTCRVIVDNNGVKHYLNTGIPTDKKFNVKLNKVGEIKGYDESNNPDTTSFYNVKQIIFDDMGSTYVSDNSTLSIKKFDSEGNMLTSFVKSGNGPGEVDGDIGHIYVVQDTFYLSLFYGVMKFTLDGEFVKTDQVTGLYIPVATCLNDSLLYVSALDLDKRGDDRLKDNYLIDKCMITDKNLNVRDTLFCGERTFLEVFEKDTDQGFFAGKISTFSSSEVFLAKRSFNNYEIDCFNFNGSLKSVIEFPASFSEYSESEKNYIKTNYGYIAHNDTGKLNTMTESKVQIASLHYDKVNDYLWVEKVMNLDDQTTEFDIFKSGKYIGSFTYGMTVESFEPLRNKSWFMINAGKLYFYDKTENAIDIYEIGYQL